MTSCLWLLVYLICILHVTNELKPFLGECLGFGWNFSFCGCAYDLIKFGDVLNGVKSLYSSLSKTDI